MSVILGGILIEMAVYQTKTFARWAKKASLQDAELYVAAQEVVAGQVNGPDLVFIDALNQEVMVDVRKMD